jgi:hypothetical protein
MKSQAGLRAGFLISAGILVAFANYHREMTAPYLPMVASRRIS